MYRIPIMSIMDTLAGLDANRKYLELCEFCRENVSYGYKFTIDNDLENRWFPVVITKDKWLAWKLIQKYGKED